MLSNIYLFVGKTNLVTKLLYTVVSKFSRVLCRVSELELLVGTKKQTTFVGTGARGGAHNKNVGGAGAAQLLERSWQTAPN